MAKPTDASYRALWATSKEKISGFLKNSLIKNNALMSEIKDKGGMLVVEDGGRVFNEPAIIGENGSAGGTRRGMPLNTDEQEGIDAFEYTPAIYAATTHIYKTDRAINAGSGRAVSLLKGKTLQTDMSVRNGLDVYLCGTNQLAGAASASDTGTQFGWLGLQDVVPDTATQDVPGTGVDKTKYSLARSAVVTTAVASATAWNTSNAGRIVVQDTYNQARFGTESPNLCLMTRSIWNAFQISLQANERFVDQGGKDQKVGYPHLMYMNNCRVAWGDNILAGHFYMLNTNFLKFKVLAEANFEVGDLIESYNTFSECAKTLVMGQLQISGPKFCSVYTGAAF